MDICFLFFLSNIWEWNGLDHMVCVCLTFKKLSKWFPKWLYILHSPEVYRSPSVITASPKLGMVNLFHSTHSVRYVVVSNCGFNRHSPWQIMLSMFSWIYYHLHIFFDKPICSNLFPILISC